MKIKAQSRRVSGIHIHAHYTSAGFFVLIAVIVSTQFPASYSLWQRIAVGIATALLYFISVAIRELVLSVRSRRGEKSIKKFTLFAFGGLWEKTKEDTTPERELLMAAARFVSNVTAAAIFYGIYATLVNSGSFLPAEITQWLAFIWFMLVLFHFIPGFPLDGGMVLRALLWKRTGDYYKAGSITSLIGFYAGLLIVFVGVTVYIITNQWFVSLLLVAAGWFLQSAAAQANRHVKMLMAVEKNTARDLMSKEFTVITGKMTIGEVILQHVLVNGRRHFVVGDGEKVLGLLTLYDINRVPRKRWDSTTVDEIMTPVREIKATYPEQSGANLLEQMELLGIESIPVLENENIIGIVIRDKLVDLARLLANFRMKSAFWLSHGW